MAMQKGYIRTYSGQRIYPVGDHSANKTREKIKLVDIAHHLSQINRYTGASKFPYSVATHSLACLNLAKARGYFPIELMAVIIHDASEAYLNDMAAPVKDLPEFAFYREVEASLQSVIHAKFLPARRVVRGAVKGLDLDRAVATIDRAVFLAEWPRLMGDNDEEGFPPPSRDAIAAVDLSIKKSHPVDDRDEFFSTVWRLGASLGLDRSEW